MDAYLDDIRALVEHLCWERAALVGYSFGGLIGCWLLSDPRVAAAALCGVSSRYVEGQDPEFFSDLATIARCLVQGCWDDHPEFKPIRAFARLDPDADFVALAGAGPAFRPAPPRALRSAAIPVLVLNGGADRGAADELDLARFIPGARRAVAGARDHGTAPSDPLFHAELTGFLLGGAG